MSKIRFITPAGVIATALAVLGVTNSPARALNLTLTDDNSQLDLNLPPLDSTKPSGLYNYLVEGVDQMNQAASWYRLGTTGAEKSIYTLTQVGSVTHNTANTYTQTFNERPTNPRFQIQITSTLNGNQPRTGTSILQTTTTITNLSTSTLSNFNYFLLSDYDLNDTPNDDTVQMEYSSITKTVSALQSDSSGTEVTTSANPASTLTRYQAGTASALTTLLNNGVKNDLNKTSQAGPGDVASAFQFVFNLTRQGSGSGSSLQITQQRTITGVPVAVPFGFSPGLGILALGAWGAIDKLRSKVQKSIVRC